MTTAQTADHWYIISGVDVMASAAAMGVVVLGDSIADGRGSTTNGNDRWPDDLARRLHANAPTAGVAVMNQGIGGNAVTTGGLGPTAIVALQPRRAGTERRALGRGLRGRERHRRRHRGRRRSPRRSPASSARRTRRVCWFTARPSRRSAPTRTTASRTRPPVRRSTRIFAAARSTASSTSTPRSATRRRRPSCRRRTTAATAFT